MDGTIGIMGAGAVGSYVGGRLLVAGRRVVLVGRGRGRDEIAANGLTTVDLDGRTRALPASQVTYVTDLSALAPCGTVLVCVKSGQTEEAGRALASVLRPGTLLVSM